jgi:uncharacterized protein with PIN domain
MSEAERRIDFFDTSALVKRYHREVGTDVVDAAFASKDVTRMISDMTAIECYSAFAKKVRTGEITEEDFRETIKELELQTGIAPGDHRSLHGPVSLSRTGRRGHGQACHHAYGQSPVLSRIRLG